MLPLIAAVSAINRFDKLRDLLSEAKIRQVPFTKLYETMLQNYLFAGYPSALTSLKILKEYFPKIKLPEAADMNLYHFRKMGELRCRKVYGDKFEKLIRNIKMFSPELSEWLVLEGYGKVLGRKGLSFRERELCIAAVLTVMKFEDQLYSHINGAIRAKANIKEIETVIKNLNYIGKNYSNFGEKVLRRFKKEKGM